MKALLCSCVFVLAQPTWVFGPYVAAEFAQGFAIHGVGGDRTLLFAVQPSAAPARARGVHVARRVDGLDLGEVQAPPEGWGTPLTIKIEQFQNEGPLATHGTFALLDNRVPPALAGTQAARVYRYSYRYSLAHGFLATLVSTHVVPLNTQPPGALPDGTVYPGSLALLPDGGLALTDNITGAIWVTDASYDHWRMALIDPRLMFGFSDDVHGIGRDEGGGHRDYTLRVPSQPGLPPTYPGVHSIAYAAVTDEVAFVRTAPPGGIYAIGRAALLDALTPPFAKGSALREVVAPTAGLSDLTDGLDYDRFHPASEWLYWQRAPSDVAGGGFNTLRRVSLRTGALQVVAKSNDVFDWANEISVLPPPFAHIDLGATWILSSMGQEENNPDVNVLLNGTSRYVSPSLMPITIVGQ
jgi:hypothetical protein